MNSLDPKGEAGKAKTPLQYIPLNSLNPISKVFKLGAEKYGENNWLMGNGIGILTYKGAILRHMSAIDRGEDVDPESGELHWAHVAASAMILLDAHANNKLVDNRILPDYSKPEIKKKTYSICRECWGYSITGDYRKCDTCNNTGYAPENKQ